MCSFLVHWLMRLFHCTTSEPLCLPFFLAPIHLFRAWFQTPMHLSLSSPPIQSAAPHSEGQPGYTLFLTILSGGLGTRQQVQAVIFNKRGYVFYYEFVGNGVCQIATTTYNAALNGGLEIVKRYPHKKKSAYVAGGLDATVASYSSGWYVDMAWKNTYDYPIYVRAYHNGGSATVELWSNHDAKRG